MMVERALIRAFHDLIQPCSSHDSGIKPYVPTIPTISIKLRGKGKSEPSNRKSIMEGVFQEMAGMAGSTHAENGFKGTVWPDHARISLTEGRRSEGAARQNSASS
jgi:hypothetical protein